MNKFVALRDTDTLGAVDSRLKVTLLVRQATGAEPLRLMASEERSQRNGTKRYAPQESGKATVFVVVRVLAVDLPVAIRAAKGSGGVRMPPTRRMVYEALRSKEAKSAFSQKWPCTGAAGKELWAGGLKTLSAQAPGAFSSLADCWMPVAYTAFTALHACKASSLRAMTRPEFASLVAWFNGERVGAALRETGVRHSDLARICTAVTLRECAVVSPPTPCEPPNEEESDFFGSLRALLSSPSGSTVAKCSSPVPQWTIDAGAVVVVSRDEQGTVFTTARYDELERHVAAVFRSVPSVLVAAPAGHGGPGAGELYAKRAATIASLLGYEHHGVDVLAGASRTWFVAPTPGHAAAVTCHGVDTLSLHDVRAGRVPNAGEPPKAVCFFFAHAFGALTFSVVIDAATRARNGDPLKLIAMCGDRLSWGGEGSIVVGDGGAPFRDACAGASKGALSFSVLETIRSEAVSPLYRRGPEATVPGEVRAAAALPAGWQLDRVPVIGQPSWRASPWPKPAADVKWWQLGKYVAIPDLGVVGAVKREHEGAARGEREQTLQFEKSPGFGQHINHMFCCRNGGVSLCNTAVHGQITPLKGGVPARLLAKWSPEKIPGVLFVAVSEDKDARVSLQDLRAACALAGDGVVFVTHSGRDDALREAASRENGRAWTRLVGMFSFAEDDDEGRFAGDVTGAVWRPCQVAPEGPGDRRQGDSSVFLFLGVAADAACNTPDLCRQALVAWLRDDPAAAHGNAAGEAAPGEVEEPPPVFCAATVQEALPDMSKFEIDSHVAARLAAYKDTPGCSYPPKRDLLDRMAAETGILAHSNGQRECVAVHVLCSAVKGEPPLERYLIAAELELFRRRSRDAGKAKEHAGAVEGHLRCSVQGIADIPRPDEGDVELSNVIDMLARTRRLVEREVQ